MNQPVAAAQPLSGTTDPPDASHGAGSTGVLYVLSQFPAFRKLWLGAIATSLGQWMQATALGWLALELTDQASYVGFVAFAAGVPFLVVSIPGGLMIDRYDRRKVLMTCQALAMTLAIIVAADVLSGRVQPAHLLVAAFLNGSLQAILYPAQQSLVADLVPRENLTNAIGLMGAGVNMTRIVGPSVAGAVIGFAGTGQAFLLQAATLVVALLLIGSAEFPARLKSRATMSLDGLMEGLRLVASRPDLRGLFLLAAVPTFFVFPYISFISIYARDILDIGPEGMGVLLAASGAGAVVGALLVAARPEGSTTGKKILTRTALYGLVILLFSFSSSIYFSVPLLVIGGFLGANFMSANNAMMQHRITDEYRGRVIGVYMLTWGLMPLGALPMGFVAEKFNVSVATGLGAAIAVGLTLLLAFKSPTLRDL